MMSNGARFSGYVQAPPATTQKQLEDIKAEWKKFQEGAHNSGRTPVLWGAEFKNVSGMTARDAEFLESRSFEIREVARLFRIPSFLIGDTDKATSFGTGMEEQNLAFRTYCLGPWLRNWEEALGYTLLTTDELRAGYRFAFDVEELQAFTISAMASFVSQMRTCSVLSPDQAREWLGYSRIGTPEMANNFAPLNSSASGAGAPQEKANPKMQLA
jgi:HK97 family phage portal protein